MSLSRFLITLPVAVLVFIIMSPAAGFSSGSAIVDGFVKASARYDEPGRRSIIRQNRDEIPAEINRLFEEAVRPGTAERDREAAFDLIERMSAVYRNVTGDAALAAGVNKRVFESRLGPVVRDDSGAGVHVVESVTTGDGESAFRPDNIVIRMGETIRWVNTGGKSHLLTSVLPGVGRGGILSPRIERGQSWEKTFTRPGDYYYMSFAGKVVYGKVTVVYE